MIWFLFLGTINARFDALWIMFVLHQTESTFNNMVHRWILDFVVVLVYNKDCNGKLHSREFTWNSRHVSRLDFHVKKNYSKREHVKNLHVKCVKKTWKTWKNVKNLHVNLRENVKILHFKKLIMIDMIVYDKLMYVLQSIY